MKNYLYLLLCLNLFFTACQPASTPYESDEFGFSIKVPSGYLIEEYENPFDQMSNGRGRFMIFQKEHFYVDGGIQIDIYPDEPLELESAKGFKILEEEPITINGETGKKYLINAWVDPPSSQECIIYRFGDEKRIYELSTVDCANDASLAEFVKGFRILE